MMWKLYIISPHVLITLAPKLQWEKMPSLYVPEAVQAEYEKFRATESIYLSAWTSLPLLQT